MLSAEITANAIQYYFRKPWPHWEGRQTGMQPLFPSLPGWCKHPPVSWPPLPKQLSVRGKSTVLWVRAMATTDEKETRKLRLWSRLRQTRHNCVLSPTVPPGAKFSDYAQWIIVNYHFTRDLQGTYPQLPAVAEIIRMRKNIAFQNLY